jgi:hypothetical protein
METVHLSLRRVAIMGPSARDKPNHLKIGTLNLEKAVGTAKYANPAKTERIGEKHRFTIRVNALFDSTDFPFAYSAYFAV